MIRAKHILGFLVVSLAFIFASCEDDTIDKLSTHTDASGLVAGTYTGTISLDSTASYSDVTVVLAKFENDSVQAVTLNIQSLNFDYSGASGMDLSTNVNVAKANDGFVFSSGYSNTLRLTGRLNDNDLTMKFPIQVRSSNQEVRFHTNGDDWTFIGTKN